MNMNADPNGLKQALMNRMGAPIAGNNGSPMIGGIISGNPSGPDPTQMNTGGLQGIPNTPTKIPVGDSTGIAGGGYLGGFMNSNPGNIGQPNNAVLPSSPMPPVTPPTVPSRVPPQWQRFATAQSMQNGYRNGWQPNPMLTRVIDGK